ncbi:hypothetical protein TNIN_153021 [Trichonephila inaurata madagascariensis]|uniref:Uncharacterized protein n=1 Tax=Trichonephila inaurata madagascariensis TaxID=2747483 RepID=A0A8X6WYF7_9ARAC|nr:hypothetical protein TNIN_153021 [Trichonephila inaurata madagascariensis]
MVLLPRMPERVSEQMRKDEEEQRDALAHPHVILTDSSALCPSSDKGAKCKQETLNWSVVSSYVKYIIINQMKPEPSLPAKREKLEFHPKRYSGASE